MTTIKVTLKDKGVAHFYRAGHKFVEGEVKTLEVDEIQLKQLQAEPKLNVEVNVEVVTPEDADQAPPPPSKKPAAETGSKPGSKPSSKPVSGSAK